MHYSILVPVEVPREEENTGENTVVKGLIETLTQKMNKSEKKDIIASIYRDRLYARQSTFARNVADAVDEEGNPSFESIGDIEAVLRQHFTLLKIPRAEIMW